MALCSCMGVFDLYTPSRSLPRGYEVTLIEGDYFLELPHRVSPRPKLAAVTVHDIDEAWRRLD